MTFSVEKNPNLEIAKKTMTCDDKIVENLSPPLSPVSHMYLFCGAPGSGKTTAMLNLITRRRKHDGFKTTYFKAFEHVLKLA